MSDNYLLIVDPYFFIYPEHEDIPLNPRLVSEFVLNLVKWAKIFEKSNCEITISSDCIQIVKRHKRSILNGKFLFELANYMTSLQDNIIQSIQPMAAQVKKQVDHQEMIGTLDENRLLDEKQVLVEIDWDATKITPTKFKTRLPKNSQNQFNRMMTDLTFARNQKFFPVAAFNNAYFLTHTLDGANWVKDEVATQIQVTYLYDSPNTDDEKIDQHQYIDQYEVVQSAEDFETQLQEPPKRRTLGDVVEGIHSKYPHKILISQEMRDQLKKKKNVLSNANRVEKAIQGLVYWLAEFIKRRGQSSEALAITAANTAYQGHFSHIINNGSEEVQRNPRYKKERLVRYDGEEHSAFLHITIFPRIYFAVIPYAGSYAVLLGVIDHHLGTKRFNK